MNYSPILASALTMAELSGVRSHQAPLTTEEKAIIRQKNIAAGIQHLVDLRNGLQGVEGETKGAE